MSFSDFLGKFVSVRYICLYRGWNTLGRQHDTCLAAAYHSSHNPLRKMSSGFLIYMSAGYSKSFAPLLYHSRSFLFNPVWRDKWQWCHIGLKLTWVKEKRTFFWCIDFEKLFRLTYWLAKTYWTPSCYIGYICLLLYLETYMFLVEHCGNYKPHGGDRVNTPDTYQKKTHCVLLGKPT